MRVLLANKFYGPRGGAESVVLQTQRLLEQAGHAVVPFAMHQEGDQPSAWSDYFVPTREYFEGSLVRRVGDSLAAIYSFDARRRLRALLRVARPDVAHLHNVYHQLTLSIVDELRAANVPIVMTLHDYKPACPNYQLLTHDGLCERCIGGAYWNAVRHRCLKGSFAGSGIAAVEAYVNRLRGVYRKIDLFLTPSAFLRDVMVRAGLPGKRISVHRNAVMAAAEPRPEPEQPCFLYFGRLAHEKGLNHLLTASSQLEPGVEVVLLGSGPMESELRTRVERERLPVRLGGFVDGEAVTRQLLTTTAALLPSMWYENCPMSILEAGALGVPTIASDIGGVPELISHGVDGILVPPGDATAIARAMTELSDPSSRPANLSAAAYRRVSEQHNEETFCEELLGHYDRVRDGHPGDVRAS